MTAPNPQQQAIIDEPGNCVVIANPGSGKTYTLSQKIQKILPLVPSFKGVIAISYTNKASDELERRCLSTGIDRKNSFFGTIDKFMLGEIVIPFGRHVFGQPPAEIKPLELKDIPAFAEALRLANEGQYQAFVEAYMGQIAEMYTQGEIGLELFGVLAVHVFRSSRACRSYLLARYSHIIIDEYQDCGFWQHQIFTMLVQAGLIGVAVGDPNQSIFKFAHREPKYLINLASTVREDLFKVYSLEHNHRCHASVVNYSLRLLSKNAQFLPTDAKDCLFDLHIHGHEVQVAQWLSRNAGEIQQRFDVTQRNHIGVLTRNNRTLELLAQNLAISYKALLNTKLDSDASMWASVFRQVLTWAYDPSVTKYELIERHLDMDLQASTVRRVMNLLRDIEQMVAIQPNQMITQLDTIVEVAKSIHPRAYNGQAVANLTAVLSAPPANNSYVPPAPKEIALMTLHKAKGSEFDVVFHLDLAAYIFPKQRDGQYEDYGQDLNLHYVGVTRAKKACVLVTTDSRHNWQGRIVCASPSEFLRLNGVQSLRNRLCL